MKIVIDVSKEAKNRLGFGVTYTQDIQAICEAIGNSTSLNDVLDKIRAEIMLKDGLEEALDIIDKYKAERKEEHENNESVAEMMNKKKELLYESILHFLIEAEKQSGNYDGGGVEIIDWCRMIIGRSERFRDKE